MQGLRCWVPLASSINSNAGTNVGAVQIAVQLTELAGLTASSSSGGGGCLQETLLLRSAEAAALLAPALRAPLLLPAGAGFRKQAAVAAVHLDVLLLPSSGSGARPKADRYFCRYSLPGSHSSGGSGRCVVTAARVLTAVGAPGVPSNLKGSGTGQSQQPALQQQHHHQWVAKMNHASFFEVGYLTALQLSFC
jgi:hypothetical protein